MRVHTWSVHRDARSFARPDAFVPDRWLADGALQPHDAGAFMPFSVGPFNCVGKNMALLELRVALCHLLQRLRLQFQEGWDPLEFERTREDRFTTRMGRLLVVTETRHSYVDG